MNTNWSSPKTNILAAMLDLRSALASGYNAKLIKARNEECQHPIRVKKEDKDFRNFEFSIGYGSSVNKIKADTTMSEFEKYLALNYINCYGTEEAVKRYYETGELSEDNFKGIGRSHLVKASDRIEFIEKNLYESGGDVQIAEMVKRQYLAPEHLHDECHLFSFFRYKHGSEWSTKKFKRKLWVVTFTNDKPYVPFFIKVLNVILYPLKFIPKKSVLKMNNYKRVTYRIGDVTNGFSIEFHIPKKFSFK